MKARPPPHTLLSALRNVTRARTCASLSADVHLARDSIQNLDCTFDRSLCVQPDNAILLLQSTKWRLLDLGIVARDGVLPLCARAAAPLSQFRGRVLCTCAMYS